MELVLFLLLSVQLDVVADVSSPGVEVLQSQTTSFPPPVLDLSASTAATENISVIM